MRNLILSRFVFAFRMPLFIIVFFMAILSVPAFAEDLDTTPAEAEDQVSNCVIQLEEQRMMLLESVAEIKSHIEILNRLITLEQKTISGLQNALLTLQEEYRCCLANPPDYNPFEEENPCQVIKNNLDETSWYISEAERSITSIQETIDELNKQMEEIYKTLGILTC